MLRDLRGPQGERKNTYVETAPNEEKTSHSKIPAGVSGADGKSSKYGYFLVGEKSLHVPTRRYRNENSTKRITYMHAAGRGTQRDPRDDVTRLSGSTPGVTFTDFRFLLLFAGWVAGRPRRGIRTSLSFCLFLPVSVGLHVFAALCTRTPATYPTFLPLRVASHAKWGHLHLHPTHTVYYCQTCRRMRETRKKQERSRLALQCTGQESRAGNQPSPARQCPAATILLSRQTSDTPRTKTWRTPLVICR